MPSRSVVPSAPIFFLSPASPLPSFPGQQASPSSSVQTPGYEDGTVHGRQRKPHRRVGEWPSWPRRRLHGHHHGRLPAATRAQQDRILALRVWVVLRRGSPGGVSLRPGARRPPPCRRKEARVRRAGRRRRRPHGGFSTAPLISYNGGFTDACISRVVAGGVSESEQSSIQHNSFVTSVHAFLSSSFRVFRGSAIAVIYMCRSFVPCVFGQLVLVLGIYVCQVMFFSGQE